MSGSHYWQQWGIEAILGIRDQDGSLITVYLTVDLKHNFRGANRCTNGSLSFELQEYI
ncbi:hypothetical protein GIB67_015531 [Kingdonia uniflora]|uniref:Uncharacterized protein n=1 Tax=Kingdonia uniflora TaxID=39325 RepID=A0A7J7LAN0_9MAGN|nr:hypothetical protein GIB67_015531 [Kingdonia uniflora]